MKTTNAEGIMILIAFNVFLFIAILLAWSQYDKTAATIELILEHGK